MTSSGSRFFSIEKVIDPGMIEVLRQNIIPGLTYMFDHGSYLAKHSRKRRATYKAEEFTVIDLYTK